ncbi:hypothetical protein BDF20DRAFT_861507 [Mycotypha africana]|uniref:uncharacterized protein n=1 Tax=Mycotypha africana TaxID=64632 RepID=UPI002300CD28|nr:uncharacterized protein BDF20DRAFT_861507 [Mycotypha africana]KAI8984736.1 hypothetical protein BDF20DRAFT_861507 [Mycotypha africana]
MQNSPRGVLIGWTSVAACALGAYIFGKQYTLNKLRDYTIDNSVTSSRRDEEGDQKLNKEGEFRRSVDRRL